MIKHLWIECSYIIWPNPPKKIFKLFFIILINNEPILTSTLAVGIVQDAFVWEAGDTKRRLEATSTAHAGNSSFAKH